MADGLGLYQYLGSSPLQRSDALGLSWREDYVAVLLPMISFLDGMMPVSIMNPIDTLFQGYLYMMQMHSFMQGAAFDNEEELDWAMDWDASDDANPRFGSRWRGLGPEPELSPSPFGILARRSAPHPNQVAFGARTETRSTALHGSVRTKRYTSFRDGRGRIHRRKLDTDQNDGGRPGSFMEVKGGRQDLSWRVRRQVLIDMRLKRTGQSGVEDIKWEFWVKDPVRPKEVSPALLRFLDDCGIKYTFQRL